MARKVRILILVLILLIGGSWLGMDYYHWYQEEQQAIRLQEQLAEENRIALEKAAQEAAAKAARVPMLQVYHDMNDDTVAFVEIPGTEISYPVVQGVDNEHYLHFAFDGTQSRLGSVFMDHLNNPQFTDQNTVIYGHNMGRPGMFYDLTKFRKQDFIDEHPYFTITLDHSTLVYEIFSVYVTEPEYDYRTTNYLTKEDYQAFLDRIIARSMVGSDVMVTAEDTIVTFSTCVYDFDDARLAVHGVLKEIREQPIAVNP